MKYLNLAYYHFFNKNFNPHRCQAVLKERVRQTSLKGTILLSHEGINLNLSGFLKEIHLFWNDLKQLLCLDDHRAKWSGSNEMSFKRMLIKVKKEIIPGGSYSVLQTAKHLAPKDLKAWLDEKRDFILLDTRNTYEIEYGTFKDALHLDLKHFRNFSKKLNTLSQDHKKKDVVMFCTGGIRCEKATIIAKEQGFEQVYQLDGGILKYFEECGHAHYRGDCFVFDHRVALTPELKPINNQLK